ncbi:MAG: hypothetical protein QME42_00120 [bacterium]|nr:hypothetical protein [bacterium]
MWKVLALIVVGVLLMVTTSVKAGNMEEDESPVGGFGGGPQIGIYYPDMSRFNDYIKKELGLDGIKDLGFNGGTLRWQINPNWQIGYNGGGIYGAKEKTVGTAANVACLYGGYHGILVSYKIPKEKLPSDKWDLAVGGGLGLFGVCAELASVNKTSKDPQKFYWMEGDTVGYQLFIEGGYKIAKILTLGGDITYLCAKIDDLKWAGEKVGDPSEIDLSGFLIRFGPRFHF